MPSSHDDRIARHLANGLVDPLDLLNLAIGAAGQAPGVAAGVVHLLGQTSARRAGDMAALYAETSHPPARARHAPKGPLP